MMNLPMQGLCAALAALALTMPARAAQPQACLIEPQAIAEIGSPVIGVVEALRVERGDRVTKGQVLAVLRADVERARR
jgi:cobalt-zinc-cadmium efflux system membrane fusion protein